MLDNFTIKKCHHCGFLKIFMSCDPRCKKLIITEKSHCPDICHLETEKVEDTENKAQGLNTVSVNVKTAISG